MESDDDCQLRRLKRRCTSRPGNIEWSSAHSDTIQISSRRACTARVLRRARATKSASQQSVSAEARQMGRRMRSLRFVR
jgi:hypothetical protein